MAQVKKTETVDEVIQETRRIKASLAESMNFDIDLILKDARQKQKRVGRRVLPPPVRQDA